MTKLQQFKQSILQRAVQGKLTRHHPSDISVSTLIYKIQQNKDHLQNEKLIHTRPKMLSPMRPQFNIPKYWHWITLQDACDYIQKGKSPKYSSYPNVPILNQKCIQWSGIQFKYHKNISQKVFKTFNKIRYLRPGDILWNTTGNGTLGRVSIVNKKLWIKHKMMVVNGDVMVVRPDKYVNSWYLLYFLSSPIVQEHIKNVTIGSTNQTHLNLTAVLPLLIPLPPLKEQNRIVSNVRICLKFIKVLQTKQQWDLHFKHKIRQSLLNQAMQGNLTKQQTSDGTAQDLLHLIQQRKQALVKANKITRQKRLPTVGNSKTPFSIPKNWKWVRLGQIANYIQRGKSPHYAKSNLPVISQKCVRWHGVDMNKARTIAKTSLKRYQPIRFLRPDDLLWNSTGTGTVGRVTKLSPKISNQYPKLVADGHVTVIRLNTVLPRFILDYLQSSIVQSHLLVTGSTNQVELRKSFVTHLLTPLPPLKEQIRIVNQLSTLFSLINKY